MQLISSKSNLFHFRLFLTRRFTIIPFEIQMKVINLILDVRATDPTIVALYIAEKSA